MYDFIILETKVWKYDFGVKQGNNKLKLTKLEAFLMIGGNVDHLSYTFQLF